MYSTRTAHALLVAFCDTNNLVFLVISIEYLHQYHLSTLISKSMSTSLGGLSYANKVERLVEPGFRLLRLRCAYLQYIAIDTDVEFRKIPDWYVVRT